MGVAQTIRYTIPMNKKVWFYLILLGHAAVITCFWWTGSGNLLGSDNASSMLALGRLAGLLLVSLVLVQLLIMSRTPWLERAFGLDKLARVHHKIGRYFIIFLLAHPLLIIASYSKFAKTGYIVQYLSLLKNEELMLSSLAFVLFLGIIIYSLLRVWKNWNFERWYYVHVTMYGAIALAYFHQLELGGDFQASTTFTYYWYAAYAFVVLQVLYFRFLLPALLYRKHHFTVTAITPETADVYSVYITGDKIDEFKFTGGQFLIVRFLAKPFYREAHPFSISKNFDGKSLRQSIKAIGDFTKTIPNIKLGTKVLIEGPYGVFTAKLSKTNKVLLIAGGIGITPYIAILEDLSKAGKNTVLIYGNKTEGDIALRVELEALSQKYNIKIHHVLSNSDTASLSTLHSPLITLSSGFITPELIKQLVPDAADRETFLCGPPPMMNALIKSLPTIGIEKNNIYFEKFSL